MVRDRKVPITCPEPGCRAVILVSMWQPNDPDTSVEGPCGHTFRMLDLQKVARDRPLAVEDEDP
jgi:hypothetical protein